MSENPNYAEAEDCLRVAGEVTALEEAKFHHDRAQVHATLALVDQLRALTETLTDAKAVQS